MENRMSNKMLKKYAKIASEAFMDDPVYKYVSKNRFMRKIVIYHRTLIRLYASAKSDILYCDEQERGLLVLKDINKDYEMSEFIKCPNAPALILLFPYVIKLFGIINHFTNAELMGDKTYTISPIFVDVQHQKKGVATNLVKRAVADMAEKGYKIGLDTQNPDNVAKYERMGFRLLKEEFYEKEQIHNYYMIHD